MVSFTNSRLCTDHLQDTPSSAEICVQIFGGLASLHVILACDKHFGCLTLALALHCYVSTNLLHLPHTDKEKLISESLTAVQDFNEISVASLNRAEIPSIFNLPFFHYISLSSISLSHALPFLIPYLSPLSHSNLSQHSSLRTYAEGERCHKPWHSNQCSS